MNVFRREKQVSVLTGLTARQRHIVWRGALEMLRREHRLVDCWIGLPGGVGACLGWFLGLGLSHLTRFDPLFSGIVTRMLLAGVGGGFGAYHFQMRLRPYLRRFIEEHQDEISRAA